MESEDSTVASNPAFFNCSWGTLTRVPNRERESEKKHEGPQLPIRIGELGGRQL